jgi:predicted DCC family thiol-disulfide oxidoreductase YuxK
MDAMYFIDERDRIWKGALAFREILRFLPMGWILRWIYFVPGGTGFSHRLYGMIARNRFLFGRRPKAEEIGVRCRKHP